MPAGALKRALVPVPSAEPGLPAKPTNVDTSRVENESFRTVAFPLSTA